MAELNVNAEFNAPIEQIWQMIRPFDSLKVWHPYVKDCIIENGRQLDEVGAIRKITLEETGEFVTETLLSLSDKEHTIIYDIIDSPMPLSEYIAKIILTPVTKTKTHGNWSVNFKPDAGEQQNMLKLLTEIYQSGFSEINELLSEKTTLNND